MAIKRNIVSGITRSVARPITVQLGALLKHLSFECEENQTVVGQIIDPFATSFEVITKSETFAIDASGNITFLSAPDYEVQNYYTLTVKSNRGFYYRVEVNVTDVLSTFALNSGTALNLATAV